MCIRGSVTKSAENFGPGTEIPGKSVLYTRTVIFKNCRKFWFVRRKVVRPLRVQRSMYSTAINRAPAHLLNCYQRIAINMDDLGTVHAVSAVKSQASWIEMTNPGRLCSAGTYQ